MLSAIGDPSGLDVLDIGCGEGYLSRELARRGAARVTGADRSQALVEAAREAAAADPVTEYTEADAADLPFGSGSFDLIVANHVLNDLPDVSGPIAELARVLRPGGRLVALILHPCFYGNRAEDTQRLSSLPPADYFSARPVEQRFLVDGLVSPSATVSWVRPLEDYTSAITAAGMAITAMTEPHPSAAQLAASSWWRDNFRWPLFLLITTAKLVTGTRQAAGERA
jgi:SAM-dependent methyltransferase